MAKKIKKVAVVTTTSTEGKIALFFLGLLIYIAVAGMAGAK